MGEEAVEQALRALRHRERSSSQIERYLEAHGVDEPDRADALATLARTGLVDDCRFAEARARVLAERGAGDALIEHDLDSAGVERATIEEVLGGLESESLRARRSSSAAARTRGPSGTCSGKGFSADVAHAAVAAARAERVTMTALSSVVFPARTRFLNPCSSTTPSSSPDPDPMPPEAGGCTTSLT